jgi:hypothetical protein
MSFALATTPWFTKNLAAGDVDTSQTPAGSMLGDCLGGPGDGTARRWRRERSADRS